MSRRFIGIDLTDDTLHLAIVEADRGKLSLQQCLSRPLEERAALAELLRELLGPGAGFGDRLCLALPARSGYLRRLEFPFRDRRKIAAALELELSGQLPVSLDHSQLAWRPLPGDDDKGAEIMAAAIPETLIAETLAQFDEPSWPLHRLDLAPFALADGLEGAAGPELLVVVNMHEVTVSRLLDGSVLDVRLLPVTDGQPREQRDAFIRRQVLALAGAGSGSVERLWLVAGEESERLQSLLAGLVPRVAIPGAADGSSVPHAQLPALLLAQGAARNEPQAGFNLRQGRFALRGEWQRLKRSLVAAAVLLVLLLASGGASAWLGYARRADQAEALQQQLRNLYLQTFPGSRIPEGARIETLMQGKVAELQRKGDLYGMTRQGSPLQLLQEISSRVPAELKLQIREFNYTAEGIRMNGFTGSFDAVNQAARSLQQSPLFAEAKISDAKMSLDGSRVDFNLSLNFATGGRP